MNIIKQALKEITNPELRKEFDGFTLKDLDKFNKEVVFKRMLEMEEKSNEAYEQGDLVKASNYHLDSADLAGCHLVLSTY